LAIAAVVAVARATADAIAVTPTVAAAAAAAAVTVAALVVPDSAETMREIDIKRFERAKHLALLDTLQPRHRHHRDVVFDCCPDLGRVDLLRVG
jgi:hypothetical protein